MKQIRKNTFETNSSSVHSLVISANKEDDEIDFWLNSSQKYSKIRGEGAKCWVENNNLYIICGRYGWEETSLRHFEDKLVYFATHFLTQNNGDIERTMYSEEWKTFERKILDTLNSHIDYTIEGIIFPKENSEGDDFDLPYIDHRGEHWESFEEIFLQNGVTLEEVIFNNKYIILIDNDNH